MNIKHLLSYLRRAVQDYNMIEENDKVAVGLSGGKDSLALLCGLSALSRFYPKPFTVCAITVDMGFEGTDYSALTDFCRSLGVEYKIVKTSIGKVIFSERREENPCSLCAKMRRGSLNEAAKALGCTKVALGHNFDDLAETFFMALLEEGRLGCFSPVTQLERVGITVIRPMLYAPEKYIKQLASREGLPVLESLCPANHKTRREEIKKLIYSLEKVNPDLKAKIHGALCRREIDGYRVCERAPRKPAANRTPRKSDEA